MFKFIDLYFLLDTMLIECVKKRKLYELAIFDCKYCFIQSVLFSFKSKTNSALTPFTMSKEWNV